MIQNVVSPKVINNVDLIPSLNKYAYSKNSKAPQIQ